MSESKKSNPTKYWLGKKRDAETRRKCGLASIGRTPWNKGRKKTDKEKEKAKNQFSKGDCGVSEETRRKLADATKCSWQDPDIREKRIHEAWNKGKKVNDEERKRLSELRKGKYHSEETRRKISEGNKGKHLSKETRRKISEALKRRAK